MPVRMYSSPMIFLPLAGLEPIEAVCERDEERESHERDYQEQQIGHVAILLPACWRRIYLAAAAVFISIRSTSRTSVSMGNGLSSTASG